MTSERKTPWTPGPWTTGSGNFSSVGVRGNDGWAVCACRFKAPTGETTGDTIAIGRANARLIAEAPAMAELLGKLAAAMEHYRGNLLVVDEARALLARIGAVT